MIECVRESEKDRKGVGFEALRYAPPRRTHLARVVRGEKQLKRAIFGAFEILCDESAMIGGEDAAPPPLAYFASSIAF